MAGLTVESLIVNVSSGRLISEAFSADISLDGHSVLESDIAQVLHAGAEHALAPERSVVHSIPIGYSLDGEHGISNPLGMVGLSVGGRYAYRHRRKRTFEKSGTLHQSLSP